MHRFTCTKSPIAPNPYRPPVSLVDQLHNARSAQKVIHVCTMHICRMTASQTMLHIRPLRPVIRSSDSILLIFLVHPCLSARMVSAMEREISSHDFVVVAAAAAAPRTHAWRAPVPRDSTGPRTRHPASRPPAASSSRRPCPALPPRYAARSEPAYTRPRRSRRRPVPLRVVSLPFMLAGGASLHATYVAPNRCEHIPFSPLGCFRGVDVR